MKLIRYCIPYYIINQTLVLYNLTLQKQPGTVRRTVPAKWSLSLKIHKFDTVLPIEICQGALKKTSSTTGSASMVF